MTPRFAVIDSSTPRLTFAEALAAYAAGGADGIAFGQTRLTEPAADLAALHASGLQVSGCFLATYSILPGPDQPSSFLGREAPPSAQDPRDRIDEMAASMRSLAVFEPDHFFVLSGPHRDLDVGEARAIVVDGLRRLAAVAAELGATLALELFDPVLSNYTFVHTIADGAALLDEVASPSLGLALDIWQLGLDPGIPAEVQQHAARVVSVHVNDRREPTRTLWDRVLPGDGVSDLAGILGGLEAGGFDGWYELEILSDDGSVAVDLPDSLWKWDPAELVRAGRAKFLESWDARRTPV